MVVDVRAQLPRRRDKEREALDSYDLDVNVVIPRGVETGPRGNEKCQVANRGEVNKVARKLRGI